MTFYSCKTRRMKQKDKRGRERERERERNNKNKRKYVRVYMYKHVRNGRTYRAPVSIGKIIATPQNASFMTNTHFSIEYNLQTSDAFGCSPPYQRNSLRSSKSTLICAYNFIVDKSFIKVNSNKICWNQKLKSFVDAVLATLGSS